MAKRATKPFILIDGSSYLYRAFHALPPLTNSKGQPTGAVYGVINMIRKLLADYDPKYVAVVFDAKGKNFRHDLYPAYKAQRPPMPPDLQVQIEPLHELIKLMGLPLLIIEGVEADDVIGALAVRAEQQGMDVLISTGDKDMAQVVSENINLINTMNNVVLDVKGVNQKFGVTPEKIIDYLALIGDSSDNIPGVPKVGPKTAVKWLEEYGSLENIIGHADEIAGKIGENLRASLKQLPLSKELVTLRLDIVLGLDPKDLPRGVANNKKLAELLQNLEFKKWLAEVVTKETITDNYQIILQAKDFNVWLAKLTAAPSFAIDTETTSLDAITAEIVGISFAINPHEAAYVPLVHDYIDAPKQLDRDWVLSKLKPLLEDPQKIKLGQNLKYDMEVLANYNIAMQGIEFDTMLESYLLNPNGRHNLDILALQHLGVNTIHFKDIAGVGKKQLTFNQIKLDKAAPYAAEDVDIVLQVHAKLWPEIAKYPKLIKVFTEIDMPLLPVLATLESNGVCIDTALLKEQSKVLATRINELEQEAYRLAEQEFNLASPKQLQEILFSKLKIPVTKKTPTGQPSTAENVLQELALDYPLPKIILEHRSLVKLKSTYTDALPQQINPRTKRVHTSYNQAVTATGRLSSTNPNLQNIPVRTVEGRKIRQAFIAPPGEKIISADYSQIELRIMAHLSKDPGLLKAFAGGDDIHQATAAEVFDIPIIQVNQEQRRKAKAINFGLIYGMSAFGLAKQLNIHREQAQKYIDLYFERYPGVKAYMEQTRNTARQQGYVETIFGRRLYVPEINSTNFMQRSAAERAAINAPMQGSAADIIKIAMINIANWIQAAKPKLKMIMQVHDELLFTTVATNLNDYTDHIRKFMCQAAKLSVPLTVDIGVGNNWDEAH